MVQFHVPKMRCDGCAASVLIAVKSVDAAADVNVDLATKLVRVESPAEAGLFAAALSWAGYPAEPRPS